MEISFPPPTPYNGDEGDDGPPGVAYMSVDERMVATAFQGTNKKKSPGPDCCNISVPEQRAGE